MSQNVTVAAEGAAVYWQVGRTSRSMLNGWKAAGFDLMIPKPRTPKALLADAMGHIYDRRDLLVRPLAKKSAFTVVREIRGQHENDYPQVATAEVNETGDVTATENQMAIQATYDELASVLPGSSVTASLVKIVQALLGVSLRDAGGIYWLPPQALAKWATVAAVAEAGAVDGDTKMYTMRTVMDAETIRAVRDGVVAEMNTAVARILEEINGGTLGERALETKQAECMTLKRRLAEYETILGQTLAEVTESIAQANDAALHAILAAGAEMSV